jgi:hypothetical protein
MTEDKELRVQAVRFARETEVDKDLVLAAARAYYAFLTETPEEASE